MDRLEFLRQMGKGLLALGLIDLLGYAEGLTAPTRAALEHWTHRVQTLCGDLRGQTIAPQAWQSEIESLLGRIPLEDLLQDVDFEVLHRKIDLPDLGVGTRYLRLPQMEGMPRPLTFVSKLFGMRAGRAIVPHGHSHMASAHLVLQGDFHLRQYEKVRSEENHLWVRPSVDAMAGPGTVSSISDDHHNIHWLIAGDRPAFTLDIIVLDLFEQPYDIHNLDLRAAQADGDQLRVPIIGVEEALRKYGKEGLHH